MDYPLDVFGQQPGLNKLYTQLCICFPLAKEQRQDAVRTLQMGLDRLTVSAPWLAGQVIFDPSVQQYTVRPQEETVGLVVKDLGDTLPSMDELRTAGFPGRMLDEKVLASCKTIRSHLEQPAPVFLVQANFVNGGLLLVVCGLHSCMDMAGQDYITALLAKACRGQSLSNDEAKAANLRGRQVIRLLSSDELAEEAPKAPERSAAQPATRSSTNEVSAVWSYIIFSGEALARLKSKATETIKSGFVSTDDCLSAFLWQAITRARFARFSDKGTDTTFTRTVDARRAAGIPSRYTGNAAVKVACHMTAQRLLDIPLGVAASQLRDALQDVGYQYRVEATLLSKGEAPNKPTVEPSTGVNLSSWAKEKTYELDFGPQLGKPEAVRRPIFEAWESLVYLMPKREDGEIAVAVCLREEDMMRLKEDPELGEYARFVG